MTIVTGAAGFIGSVLVKHLNAIGREDLVLVDDFDRLDRAQHLDGADFRKKVERVHLEAYLRDAGADVRAVFHLGALTDTTEIDEALFLEHNLLPSQLLWDFCSERQLPFIYASSASTYGGGELGYREAPELLTKLVPLNAYGRSKHDFDVWASGRDYHPPFWAGLKFFNVYGPHEEHKDRMASVVLQAFQQICISGRVKLFRSHRPGIADGEQSRDFVYVDDVCEVLTWLLAHRPASGLYNLGTGRARTFKDLAVAVFAALSREPAIEYIDTPLDIRDAYQYFTEADITKLRAAGYDRAFTTLEDGVYEYVHDYLLAKMSC